MEFRYLIVDDDPDVLKAAQVALMARGASVDLCESLDGLAARTTSTAYDAILLDMNFAVGERSGREGLAGLSDIRDADPALSVVLMTTFGGVALAVEALKSGAADFVLKPWRNETLAATLSSAAERTRERRRAGQLNLDDIERQAIEQALARHGGNVSRAAADLGLTRPALYRRIERHGL